MDQKRFAFREASIAKLSVPGDYYDTSLKPFSVRVNKNSKVFQVIKRKNGKNIRVKICEYIAGANTLAYAKEQALIILAKIERGINPNDEAKYERTCNHTLRFAFNDYMRSRSRTMKASTMLQYRQLIENFVSDWLDMPIRLISRAMIRERYTAIAFGKFTYKDDGEEKKRKASPSNANGLARVLNAVWHYAEDSFRDHADNKILTDNPITVLGTQRQYIEVERRTRRIRDSQLSRWLEAVDHVRTAAAYDKNKARVSICDALLFCLYTGLRKTSVFELTWDRVCLQDGYYWIDETKNGQRLELPVTAMVRTILLRRKELGCKSKYVFEGKGVNRPISEPEKTIRDIVIASAKTGEPIEFTTHDTRRTFGSIAELEGVGTYTIKRLMGHKVSASDVTNGYMSWGADELREPALKVERGIMIRAGITHEVNPIDQKLSEVIASMSDDDKRKMLIEIAMKSADERKAELRIE